MAEKPKTVTEYVVEYRAARWIDPRISWQAWERYDDQADAESLAERLCKTMPGVGRKFRIVKRVVTETVIKEPTNG